MKKEKIKIHLRKYPTFLRLTQYVYNVVLNKERVLKKVSFGNSNSSSTILLIRPNAEDGIQGLMSLFIQAMRWIDYAKRKGLIPYIDFKNYKTQYYNGKSNVWEYYFTQPSNLKYDDVYSSKNVIISGASINEKVNNKLFRDSIFKDSELCSYCSSIIWDNINFSDEVISIINKENKRIKVEKCIGVYIRGTDYAKLKPVGEYVQPNINSVISIIDTFIEKHGCKKMFLVTEDYSYYIKLKEKYKDNVLIVSFDCFVKDYAGTDFLSRSSVLKEDKKSRGMDYLVKIIMLSRCKYLISSITMGSIAAYAFNGNQYEDSYVFDLGTYQ